MVRGQRDAVIEAVNSSTHIHDDDQKRIEAAMRAVAKSNSGFIDPNKVRATLTGKHGLTVEPRVLSARYAALSGRKIIARAGSIRNLDSAGRNQGKPMWLYEVTDEAWLNQPDAKVHNKVDARRPYTEFLADRAQHAEAHGFAPTILPDHLFDFQRMLVEWAVRQGRAALFADCGMGKTPMELTWAENVHRATGRPVLLLTPLAVGFQVVAEAEKFGHDAQISRTGRPAKAAITVTNYEQLSKFDPADFAGVVCDESSAVKAFDGKTKATVTEFMRRMPYRLLGTATAAPNDYLELGTSSEALGELGYMDMLSRFFTNKNRTVTNRSSFAAAGRDVGWRFKGHAELPFWRWVSSWARAIRTPSDYGFSDDGFQLPPLEYRTTVVEAHRPAEGTLFDVPASGLAEEREEARRTLTERCEAAAERVHDANSAVLWCHLNDESSRLAHLLPGAVEVTGSDSPEAKEEKLAAFSRGEIRHLVTKPKIGAWGLNWQHCHRMTYFPSHSYEQHYQAVRRSWRFGQQSPVTVDVITTKGGEQILANLRAKAAATDRMFTSLIHHMNDALRIERSRDFNERIEVPSWLSQAS